MEIILFTKTFGQSTIAEIGETALHIGFDGLDLAVRPGQCIDPANAPELLPAATKRWHDMGLTLPLVTLPGNFTDPAASEAEPLYAALQNCGIGFAKIGYWQWDQSQSYWARVDEIRRALEGFEKLGRKYGVCSLIHTHAGNFYAVNVSAAMHLARGFDPRYVAVYVDPAHQALDGENVPMSLGIAGDYLKMVGVKNHRYVRKEDGSGWDEELCLLPDGLVDWRDALAHLKRVGYPGPLVMHAEYTGYRDHAGAMMQVEKDMAYIRPLLRNVG